MSLRWVGTPCHRSFREMSREDILRRTARGGRLPAPGPFLCPSRTPRVWHRFGHPRRGRTVFTCCPKGSVWSQLQGGRILGTDAHVAAMFPKLGEAGKGAADLREAGAIQEAFRVPWCSAARTSIPSEGWTSTGRSSGDTPSFQRGPFSPFPTL